MQETSFFPGRSHGNSTNVESKTNGADSSLAGVLPQLHLSRLALEGSSNTKFRMSSDLHVWNFSQLPSLDNCYQKNSLSNKRFKRVFFQAVRVILGSFPSISVVQNVSVIMQNTFFKCMCSMFHVEKRVNVTISTYLSVLANILFWVWHTVDSEMTELA